MNDEELYVHRESVTSYVDINRELASYFSCAGTHSHCPPDSVLQESNTCMRQLKFVDLLIIYATADEVDAYVLQMFFLFFFLFFFCFFRPSQKYQTTVLGNG